MDGRPTHEPAVGKLGRLAAALLGALLFSLPRPSSAGFTNLGQVFGGLEESAVAWGDFDNDGDLDLAVAGRDASYNRITRILENRGGVFTNLNTTVPGMYLAGLAWGDFDNDGDLDLAAAGAKSTGTATAIYRNDGGVFADIEAGLAPVYHATPAWGDMDNDGDLDLVVLGYDASNQPRTTLYCNRGRGIFSAVDAGLLNVYDGDAAWADYDRDGDLDLAIAGYSTAPVTVLYRNDGGGHFTNTGMAFSGLYKGMLAWGDYDNDGDLDLAMAGRTKVPTWTNVTLIYRNDGTTFTSLGATLAGVYGGGVAWGDYDNDGDLDLVVVGQGNSAPVSALYRNDGAGAFVDSGEVLKPYRWAGFGWGDFDGDNDLDLLITGRGSDNAMATSLYRNDGAAGTPPTAPSGLSASVTNDYDVTLRWNAATDAETPAGGLGYNVYVGSAVGLQDALAGHAEAATGLRRVPALGNAQQRLFHSLADLCRSTQFVWGVQAVDTTFRGGPFATGTFSVAAAPDIGILGNGQPIANWDLFPRTNDATLFGPLPLWGGPATHRFVVTNSGRADLVLPAGLEAVRITGTHSNDFALLARPTNAIAPGSSAPLAIAFQPRGLGSRTATVNVANNDPDAHPFLFAVRGTGYLLVPSATVFPETDIYDAEWGDYDGDGDLDLALAVWGEGEEDGALIYRNDGAAGFTNIHASVGAACWEAVAWGDIDGDGDLDLAVAGDGTPGLIYRNDGAGAFANTGVRLPALWGADLAWADCDNDGDLDLAMMGYGSGGPVTALYRNEGFGLFADRGDAFTPTSDGGLAWADYDGDGDLDLAVGGDSSLGPILRIYRNDAGTFASSGASLGVLADGNLAWGDYDNDGDPDLAAAGERNVTVFRNNGAGAFTAIQAGLRQSIDYADVAWADYDNDGDLDLLVAGYNRDGPPYAVSDLYENAGGVFVNTGADLAGVETPALAWGDPDADGDIDLFLAGYDGDGNYVAILYRSDSSVSNAPPSPPSGLTAFLTNGTQVVFRWDPALDASTPPAGLTYNLAVGVTPAGGNILAPHARLPDGWRTLPAAGNTRQSRAWKLTPEPACTSLYWAVQAVDSGWSGSPFAAGAVLAFPLLPEISLWGGGRLIPHRDYAAAVADGTDFGPSHPAAAEVVHSFVITNSGQVSLTLTGASPVSVSGATGEFRVAAQPALSSLPPGGSTAFSIGFDPAGIGLRTALVSVANNDLNEAPYRFGVRGLGTEFADTGTALPVIASPALAWGDYDGDGDPDLVLCGRDPSFVVQAALYRNDAGTLVDSGVAITPLDYGAAAWGDYDNDGNLDLALCGRDANSQPRTILYRNNGNGAFSEVAAGFTGIYGGSLAWADYNNDGRLDIVLSGRGLTLLYRNTGSGFVEVADPFANLDMASVAWADYDRDGDADLAILGSYSEIGRATYLYRNNGNGTFTDAAAGLFPATQGRMAWGDYDNDGDLDLAIAAFGNSGCQAGIYRNNGSGGLALLSSGLPNLKGDVAWGDCDNDGDLDLLITGYDGTRLYTRLFRNNGGTFAEAQLPIDSIAAYAGDTPAVAWADVDNDGDLDFVCVGQQGAKLMRNGAANPNTAPSAPAGLNAVRTASNVVQFTWGPASDAQTAAAGLNYNLYVGTAPLAQDLNTAMADAASGQRQVVAIGNAAPKLTRTLSGMPGNTTLYWGVQAIDAVYKGSAFATSVLRLDSTGPQMANVTYRGAAVTNGLPIRHSGAFAVGASDISAIGRVEFYVDGARIGTDTSGADGYSAMWNAAAATDGPHQVVVRAYDSLENASALTNTVALTLAPPLDAPVITAPANNAVVSQSVMPVGGTADPYASQVRLYRNNAPAGGLTDIGGGGAFAAVVILTNGANTIQAAALNRAGEGPRSTGVTVTLDKSVPGAPLGVEAAARAGGAISVRWWAPSSGGVSGYELYRAGSPFASTSEAQRVGGVASATPFFTDLPPSDGTYYYRVLATNAAGTRGGLSAEVSAVSDRTPPRALSVTYSSTGPSSGGRYGPGAVTVTVAMSEPLSAAPFFSVVRTNAPPVPVTLTRRAELTYGGAFSIATNAPAGIAYATLSCRDAAGNRGTEIDAGGSIVIDTVGPQVAALLVAPPAPIRNDPASPATVTVRVQFSTNDLPVAAPALDWVLSATAPQPVALPLSAAPGGAWEGSFALPPAAGSSPELLSFRCRGEDDLGNISTTIPGSPSFQVYQGTLPPLDPPAALTARALPGSRVELRWVEVAGSTRTAIFRQAPGEAGLTFHAAAAGTNAFEELAPEGSNRYAVASVREANGQSCTGVVSAAVLAVADGVPPARPTDVALRLIGQGVRASWRPPTGEVAVAYNLYRDEHPIDAAGGLVAVAGGVAATNAIDAHPQAGPRYYAVTALDAAGNESSPSASASANVSLLPVNSLSATRTDDGPPEIAWAHPDAAHISGFNVYVGPEGRELKVNAALLPNAATGYIDSGYDGRERRIGVAAVDTHTGAEVESVRRWLVLPALDVQLGTNAVLGRGVMNRLEFRVSNGSTNPAPGLRLRVEAQGRDHFSDGFALGASTSAPAAVAVGGYADLPESVTLLTSIFQEPNAGERVEVRRTLAVPARDDCLGLDILSEPFVRGGVGKARFALRNTGSAAVEIVMSRRGGSQPSDEVRFKLLDAEGSVYGVQAVCERTGEGLVLLPDGTTVARLAAGASFACAPVDLAIPSAAPDELILQAEIDAVHAGYGGDQAVSLAGPIGRRTVSLRAPPYAVEVSGIDPASSAGDRPVSISGRAVIRGTGEPAARSEVRVAILFNGFERAYTVYTDAAGEWRYAFNPVAGESGTYTVCAMHPDVRERWPQGEFRILGASVTPASVSLVFPRDYRQTVSVTVRSGEGLALTNLNLAYEAADQPGGACLPDIEVLPHPPVPYVSGGQSVVVRADVRAGPGAPASGTLVLRARSAGPEPGTWGTVSVRYSLLPGQPMPALQASPAVVETGVAVSNLVSEEIVLENQGYAPVERVRVELVDAGGHPAPAWAALSAPAVESIAVGARLRASLTFNPDASVPLSGAEPYAFLLRVTGSNPYTNDTPVYVFVNDSGAGHALVKVMDMYTGTLDAENHPIPGLAGAQVKLVREQGSALATNLVTDAQGECFFEGLPTGRYSVRVSAPGHEARNDRLWIKPGVTEAREYTLAMPLVTVEWSVTEITLEDRYDVTLRTTYRTDVPAPVLVCEPAQVRLTGLGPGDVLQGEMTLKNYGLIRADDVAMTFPASDGFFKYEFLAQPPSGMEARQLVRLPYRVTCLARPDGSGGGGGCYAYNKSAGVRYRYECINGQRVITASPGTCFSDNDTSGCGLQARFDAGSSGGFRFSPAGSPMRGVDCSEDPCGKDKNNPCCKGKGTEAAGSAVSLFTGEYQDDAEDLKLKVLGYDILVARRYGRDGWQFNFQGRDLVPTYEVSAAGRQLAGVTADGTEFEPADEARTVFAAGEERLFVESNGYSRVRPDGTWQWFDADGKLAAYGDRNGRKVGLLHDGAGRVVGMTDTGSNRVLWVEYAGDRVSAVRDAAAGGRSVAYAYDGAGRLTNVVGVLGGRTAYAYDGTGALVFKRTAAGRETRVAYNAEGKVASVLDAEGQGKFFSYDYDAGSGEYYAQIVTTRGDVYEKWFDAGGEETKRSVNGTVPPESSVPQPVRQYDARGNLIREELPGGAVRTYAYHPVLNLVTQQVNELGVVTESDYDERGNLVRLTEAAGTAVARTTRYSYDGVGNRISMIREATTNTAEAVTRWSYDAWGNVAGTTDPEGHVTSNTYDRSGNILSATDGAGVRWTYDYDAVGHLLARHGPGGYVVSNRYDLAGNRVASFDPYGRATRYEYDDEGRETSRTDPYGTQVRYEYDPQGRQVRQILSGGSEAGSTYDALGRVKESWAFGGAVTRYEYDAAGRVVAVTDPDGNRSSAEYDALGRKVRVRLPLKEQTAGYDAAGNIVWAVEQAAGVPARTNRFVYDASGRMVAAEGPGGAGARYEFDALGRRVLEVSGGVETNRCRYDARDNVVGLVDANGNETRAVYDRNNLPILKIYPDGSRRAASYDAAGRPVRYVMPRGDVIRLYYNELGWVTGKWTFAASDTNVPAQRVRYSYDLYGRTTGWEDGTFRETRTYDDANRRVTRAIDYGPFTKTVTSTYDEFGRVARIDGPDAEAVVYGYDAKGRWSNITLPDEGSITVNSNRMGRPASVTLPGGLRQEFQYGAFGLASNALYRAGGEWVCGISYALDGNDNLVRRATPAGASEFSYDRAERLVAATVAGLPPEAFTYDAAGNRLSGPSGTESNAYNELNQLLRTAGAAMTYDRNGNLESRAAGGVTNRYEYDAENRLTAIRDGDGGVRVRYAYAPGGERLMKQVGGVVTYFLYSPLGLTAEFAADGTATRTYGYYPSGVPGGAAAWMKTGGRRYYFFNDGLGAPQLLIADDGRVVWTVTTSAFGQGQPGPASSVQCPLRGSAQYCDSESGLHYNTHRYYDPSTGRYLSRDPIEEQGGANLYLFAANNPATLIDPLALKPQELNCYEIHVTVSAASYAFTGAEINFGVKGTGCDCCDPENGTRDKDGKYNVRIELRIEYGIGLGIKAEVLGLGINALWKAATHAQTFSLGSEKACFKEPTGATATYKGELKMLYTSLGMSLGLGGKVETGYKWVYEVKISVTRRQATFAIKTEWVEDLGTAYLVLGPAQVRVPQEEKTPGVSASYTYGW